MVVDLSVLAWLSNCFCLVGCCMTYARMVVKFDCLAGCLFL